MGNDRAEVMGAAGEIEQWAEAVANALAHIAPDKRAKVLALAAKNEEAERRKCGWRSS